MSIFNKMSAMVVAAVCLTVASFSVNAAQAAGPEIVVLDMQKAVANSDAGKKAQATIEKKLKELQEKFKKDEDALVALQEEIEKKSSVWSEEKKQDKAIEFQKKRRDLRVKQDDANLELKQMQEKELSPILKELETVVAKVAEEKGYKIILPSATVVYNASAVNITDEVTKALNEKAK